MPFTIIRNDLVNMKVDAIVSSSDEQLSKDGWLNAKIHDVAGQELLEACKRLKPCKIGEVKVTSGYHLPANYIFFTVTPFYHAGLTYKEQLQQCYTTCLKEALHRNLTSIAFPLLATGANQCPKELSLTLALRVFSDFLMKHELDIYLVVYDEDAFQVSNKLFPVQEYIDDHYLEQAKTYLTSRIERPYVFNEEASVQHFVKQLLQDSFSLTLMQLIKEKKMEPKEVYKRANIDRKLFSKIKNDVHYRPSKPTVVAFAIALKLNLEETKHLLQSAGYALSYSYVFDIIIEYYITQEIYDIFEINEALFYFDQTLLGF